MPSTKGKIREEAKKLIKGGDPSAGSNISNGQIDAYIEHCINTMLRTEYYSLTLPGGETIPTGCMIANYYNVPVVKYKKTSRAKLPAFPINLPRNMGIFKVALTDDCDCPIIPVQPGQAHFLQNQKMLNELISTTYEPIGGYVEFSKDLSGDGSATVDMQLLVMDMSTFGDYDILPLSGDMEKEVIDTVVARFFGGPRPDKVVDSGSEPSKIQGR